MFRAYFAYAFCNAFFSSRAKYWLFTNYKRNEVLAEYAKSKTENRPAINGSYRKKNVKPLKLESVFMTRADYNDLGDAFQITFQKVADTSLFIHLSLRFDLFDN